MSVAAVGRGWTQTQIRMGGMGFGGGFWQAGVCTGETPVPLFLGGRWWLFGLWCGRTRRLGGGWTQMKMKMGRWMGLFEGGVAVVGFGAAGGDAEVFPVFSAECSGDEDDLADVVGDVGKGAMEGGMYRKFDAAYAYGM